MYERIHQLRLVGFSLFVQSYDQLNPIFSKANDTAGQNNLGFSSNFFKIDPSTLCN